MRENQLWALGYLMIGIYCLWLGWEYWRGQGFDVSSSSDIELRRSAATTLVKQNSDDPPFVIRNRSLTEDAKPDGTNGLGPVETPRRDAADTFIFSGPAKALAFPANSEEDVTTTPNLHWSNTIPNGTYVAFKPSTDGKTIDVRTMDDSSLFFSYTPEMDRIEVPDIRGFVHICYEGNCVSVADLFEAWRK